MLVAASTKDIAATNIAQRLLEKYPFKPISGSQNRPVYECGDVLLTHVDVDGVYAEGLENHFNVESIIFASRHRSDSGTRTFAVHATGNPNNRADFGGVPRSLAWADPARIRTALAILNEKVSELKLSYKVSMEATHHGPTESKVPITFIEIGSGESEWNDKQAGEVAAEAVWRAAVTPVKSPSAVGFGGGHYPVKHTEMALKGEVAVGHVLPKYFFEEYDPDIVRQAIAKTVPKCSAVVIDWKGVKGQARGELLELIDSLHVRIIKV